MNKLLVMVMLAATLVAIVAAACGDDDDSSSTPTPTPTDPASPTETPGTVEPTPTPTPPVGEAPSGLYGHGTRTGVPEIDKILAAWENGDIDTLVALAKLQSLECVTVVEGAGGPPKCPEGVANGTVVQVFAAAACEGYWVYPDGIAAVLQSFSDGFEGKPYYLYAAWHADATQYEPAGYRIQFARSVTDFDIFSPQIVLDENGAIFRYLSGCNPAPVQVPAGADWVLEPKGGAFTGTGIPSVDNFLKVRQQQNANAMANLVTMIQVPCKLPTEADYWPYCPSGEPSGTMVDAWPWWGCHGAWSNGGTREQIAEFFVTYEGEVAKVLRFEPSGTVDMFPAEAGVAVLFERPDDFAWAAVLDDDGNFYGMVSGCPLDVEGLAEFHFSGAQVLWEA